MGKERGILASLKRALFSRRTKTWIRSIFASAITGSANAVLGGGMLTVVVPGTFNFAEGLPMLINATLGLTVTGGVVGVAAFLARSPLPDTAQSPQQIQELKP